MPEFIVTFTPHIPITADTGQEASERATDESGHWEAEDVNLVAPRQEFEFRRKVFHEAVTSLDAAAYAYVQAITRSHFPDAHQVVLEGHSDEMGDLTVSVDKVKLNDGTEVSFDHADQDMRDRLETLDTAANEACMYLAETGGDDYYDETEIDL